jgi:hypothetical protein
MRIWPIARKPKTITPPAATEKARAYQIAGATAFLCRGNAIAWYHPLLTIFDELGQVRGPRSELFEALATATAGQLAPLSIIVSTQAPTDADLLSVLIDDALTGHDPASSVRSIPRRPMLTRSTCRRSSWRTRHSAIFKIRKR